MRTFIAGFLLTLLLLLSSKFGLDLLKVSPAFLILALGIVYCIQQDLKEIRK